MTDESTTGEPDWVSHPAQGTPPPAPTYPGPLDFAPPPGYPTAGDPNAPGYYAPPPSYPAPASQYGPPYYPAAGPPFGYPPPYGQNPFQPKRSHRGWWVAAIIVGAVVVLAVIGGIANVVANNTTDSATAGRTFTAPSTFAGHTLDPDLTATVKAKIPQLLDGLPSSVREDTTDTQIAIYDQDNARRKHLTYLGIEWSQPKKSFQKSYIKGVLHGAGASDSRSFDPGPLGGYLSCGTGSTGFPTCAWADSSMGTAVADRTAADLDEAAADTRALRAAGEH